MRTPYYIMRYALVIAGFVISSCSNDIETSDSLSTQDKEFITGLGLLNDDERIILFDSQGGGFNEVEVAGNFFTDRRIASYWIDKRDTSNTHIDYAFYADIDTIWRYPKFKSLTLASHLEVHRQDGTRFKVYVSADSIGTWNFFNRALEEWGGQKRSGPRAISHM